MACLFYPDRRHDWPERLELALDEHAKGAFQWGQYDCATLFSDVAFAMTGEDPFYGFKWQSSVGAGRCLVAAGVQSVKEFLDRHFPPAPVAALRRGDCGLPKHYEPLMCPAIVVGQEAVSRAPAGWVRVPVSVLAFGYRIGR